MRCHDWTADIAALQQLLAVKGVLGLCTCVLAAVIARSALGSAGSSHIAESRKCIVVMLDCAVCASMWLACRAGLLRLEAESAGPLWA